MDLFIVVIAILFVQVWGADNPLHRDRWFFVWMDTLKERVTHSEDLRFIATIVGPIVLLIMLIWVLGANSNWLQLPVGVVILLYSFGRGEFSELLNTYTSACAVDNWSLARDTAESCGADISAVAEEDWSSLHHLMFESAAYRGFERMFSVLFWFFIAGPVGALAYRLVFLFNTHQGEANANTQQGEANALAKKILWLLEWPAVRILGISFAITGNFAACIARWRESVFCLVRPTVMTVAQAAQGALSVDDDMPQDCEVTRRELNLLDGLYRRTLWFWLGFVAIIVILM